MHLRVKVQPAYGEKVGGFRVEGLRGIVFPGDALEHASSGTTSTAARHLDGAFGRGILAQQHCAQNRVVMPLSQATTRIVVVSGLGQGWLN